MTGTTTGTMTYARTELIRAQALWTDTILNPESTAYSRGLIRAAFDSQSFRWVAYYALGPDGRCFACLRVELDAEVHREQVRLATRVKIPSTWVDRVAPELRILVEEFENLVAKFKFRVVGRLGARRGAMPPAERANPAPAILWADGPRCGFPQEIRGLKELVAQYVLSDTLAAPST